MKRNQTEFLKLCLADSLIKLMADKPFEDISVNAICEKADVGRTTFYRHLDHKNCKEDLLLFKIEYEWARYADNYDGDFEKDKGGVILRFIYANRKLFTLLNDNDLLALLMRVVEKLMVGEETYPKELSYIMSYFIHGYFGIIYQWIKYGFDETPEQVEAHVMDAISSAAKANQK